MSAEGLVIIVRGKEEINSKHKEAAQKMPPIILLVINGISETAKICPEQSGKGIKVRRLINLHLDQPKARQITSQ